jgi:hypothetical protein
VNWQSREDERVARALDGAPPPSGRPAVEPDPGRAVAGLVALAGRVREVGGSADLGAAPAFRDALRARLLAEGAALLPHPRQPADPGPAATPSWFAAGGPDGPTREVTIGLVPGEAGERPARTGPPRHRPPGHARRGRRRRVAVAGLVAVGVLSASTVAASGNALPGDPLYGLKRRVQGVEVALARGDEDRGQRHLELARTRVRELGTAGRSAPAGPLIATLDDMDAETRTGVRMVATAAVRRTDESRLAALGAWTTEQRSLLAAAATRLPEPARVRAAASSALLASVAARTTSLRGSLRCDDCGAAPVDELGPRPCAGCAPPPAAPVDPSAATGPVPPAPRPTAAATTAVPVPVPDPEAPRPAPTAGAPAPSPTASPEPPGPSAHPPAASTPAPRPPEQPDPTADASTPPPADPGGAVTDLLDGLLGAIGLGGR